MPKDTPPLSEDEPLTDDDRRMIAQAELFERRHRARPRSKRASSKQPTFVLTISQKEKSL
jgi:hypothetical protein